MIKQTSISVDSTETLEDVKRENREPRYHAEAGVGLITPSVGGFVVNIARKLRMSRSWRYMRANIKLLNTMEEVFCKNLCQNARFGSFRDSGTLDIFVCRSSTALAMQNESQSPYLCLRMYQKITPPLKK